MRMRMETEMLEPLLISEKVQCFLDVTILYSNLKYTFHFGNVTKIWVAILTKHISFTQIFSINLADPNINRHNLLPQ